MAKRSPILGYNHNVRYRGLVFHVQTEDSGVLSPHLFTHLFHAGVIVSTRKLVYDSGSNEEAIKSLMQAQHKAVLKELKKGQFDDKIDAYLGGTPGLLPRGADVVEDTPVPAPPIVPQAAVARGKDAEPASSRAKTDADQPSIALKPTDLAVKAPRGTQPPPNLGRAQTAERTSSNNTVRTERPELDLDSSPEIEILKLEPDESDEAGSGRRSHRDTDVATPADLVDEHTRPTVDVSALSDGIPGLVGGARTPAPGRPNDSIPPLPPPPTGARRSTPNAVGASALPPARPISRPPSRPAITPPQVVSRPLPPDDRRSRETDAIEVYAPAPPSVEPPPGVNRASGQYSQHKRSDRIALEALKERPTPGSGSQSAPIPPGLGRPGRGVSTPAVGVPRQSTNPPGRDTIATPPPVPVVRPPAPPETQPVRARTPTPARISPSTPTPSRTSTGAGGVVMTRPAVIVGAPAKPTQPRVRKAREDEGRGFGQGLISEKSLDEVILAYLSEDAEEK